MLKMELYVETKNRSICAKTLSFSKCESMHELMLKSFIHRHNLSLVK